MSALWILARAIFLWYPMKLSPFNYFNIIILSKYKAYYVFWVNKLKNSTGISFLFWYFIKSFITLRKSAVYFNLLTDIQLCILLKCCVTFMQEQEKKVVKKKQRRPKKKPVRRLQGTAMLGANREPLPHDLHSPPQALHQQLPVRLHKLIRAVDSAQRILKNPLKKCSETHLTNDLEVQLF